MGGRGGRRVAVRVGRVWYCRGGGVNDGRYNSGAVVVGVEGVGEDLRFGLLLGVRLMVGDRGVGVRVKGMVGVRVKRLGGVRVNGLVGVWVGCCAGGVRGQAVEVMGR